MQLHIALRERFQRRVIDQLEAPHGQILRALQRGCCQLPPWTCRIVVAVDEHLPRAATGFQQALLVRLAQFDPFLDQAGQILAPQVRLVRIAQALAELQMLVRMQCEHQQPHHHAFIGFGRMPRQRQRVVAVVVAIHVGDLKLCFEDGCLEGHSGFYSIVRS